SLPRTAGQRRRGRRELRDPGRQPHRLQRRFAVDAAVLQRLAPELLEALAPAVAPVQLAPPALEILLERRVPPRTPSQHVSGVPRVREYRLHHGLQQREQPGPRARIVPLLEGTEIRADEARRGGRRR